MNEKTVWRKARKKPVIVEFREVKGEVEKIETREGVLYAFPEVDFIIRGVDGEGVLYAFPEVDFIIRGVDGEIYPIKKEIFFKTYEVIEE